MTTEERIENLEKRVKVLENLLKLTAVDDWIEKESAKIALVEKVITESDDDSAKNAFIFNKEVVEFVKTWSDNVHTILDIGLDKEIEK